MLFSNLLQDCNSQVKHPVYGTILHCHQLHETYLQSILARFTNTSETSEKKVINTSQSILQNTQQHKPMIDRNTFQNGVDIYWSMINGPKQISNTASKRSHPVLPTKYARAQLLQKTNYLLRTLPGPFHTSTSTRMAKNSFLNDTGHRSVAGQTWFACGHNVSNKCQTIYTDTYSLRMQRKIQMDGY